MPDFKTMFNKSIEESFNEFHQDNPHIYAYYIRFAIEWLETGANKISSKQIIGRIRWFLDVETKGKEAEAFKINDAFTAHYSRLFTSQYPQFESRIEFRRLRS